MQAAAWLPGSTWTWHALACVAQKWHAVCLAQSPCSACYHRAAPLPAPATCRRPQPAVPDGPPSHGPTHRPTRHGACGRASKPRTQRRGMGRMAACSDVRCMSSVLSNPAAPPLLKTACLRYYGAYTTHAGNADCSTVVHPVRRPASPPCRGSTAGRQAPTSQGGTTTASSLPRC